MKEKHHQLPIVCGTDFSPTATEALDVAAAMARQIRTRLVLAHVEEYSGMAQVDPGLFEEALLQKRGDLETEATRLRGLGTDVEIKLLSGSVFDELVSSSLVRRSESPLRAASPTARRTPAAFHAEIGTRSRRD